MSERALEMLFAFGPWLFVLGFLAFDIYRHGPRNDR
jgi:hypothetical protein